METISRHVEISLNELIHRQNLRMAAIHEQAAMNPQLLEANIKQVEDRLSDLNSRLDRRRDELKQERQCTIGDIQHDQLYYLAQCGFNAFAIREDRSAEDALAGLAAFSDGYQATHARTPWFRRRAAAASAR